MSVTRGLAGVVHLLLLLLEVVVGVDLRLQVEPLEHGVEVARLGEALAHQPVGHVQDHPEDEDRHEELDRLPDRLPDLLEAVFDRATNTSKLLWTRSNMGIIPSQLKVAPTEWALLLQLIRSHSLQVKSL